MTADLFDTVAIVIYIMCAATSLACAWLLWRGYLATRVRLLFWSALCFSGFFAHAVLVVVDLRVMPTVDLSVWRPVPSLLGLTCLLVGMIWEVES